MIGIYTITNTVTGQRYIGQSINVDRRLYAHMHALKRGTHGNTFLQRSFAKYGAAAFEGGPILACRREDLDFYERHLVRFYRSDERQFGFNLTEAGESSFQHTADTRAKIAAANVGRVFTPDTLALMSRSASERWEKPHGIALREKLSRANRGKTLSAETRVKLSDAGRGKTHGPDTRAKMARAHKGKPKTAEHRAKIGVAARQRTEHLRLMSGLAAEVTAGVPLSPDHRAKISLANKGRPSPLKGRPRAPETVAKMAEASRLRWADPEYKERVSAAISAAKQVGA
jgi:group I intron endonuclease